jgi:hypothetical protein
MEQKWKEGEESMNWRFFFYQPAKIQSMFEREYKERNKEVMEKTMGPIIMLIFSKLIDTL